MKPDFFFQQGISDNNYQGYALDTLDLDSDFYCNTHRMGQNNRISSRRLGVENFVKEIFHLIAEKNLSELNISQIVFDEEFEANQEQKIFDISGYKIDDLKIFTGNIVGSINYRQNHFNINCRFGNEFLKYMIASTSGFLEIENLGSIDNSLGLGEWILTYYWKLQLKKSFSLGIYKTYQKKQGNLLSLRGTIDFAQQMKKAVSDGKTFCNYKEHSYKNELNSVISMALKKVFKSKYQPIVADIYNIKNAFDSINTNPQSLRSIRRHKVVNPYYLRYNQVFDLSLKILKDEFANIGQSNSELSAFLFDISLLFEHHVRKILKEKFTLFPKNKKEFTIPNGIFENNIYPDIIIEKGNNEIEIYDVKYKNFNFVKGVEREDQFQLITYAATHLSEYKVTRCGFIYPFRGENADYMSTLEPQYLKINGEKVRFNIQFYMVSKRIEEQKQLDQAFLNEFNETE